MPNLHSYAPGSIREFLDVLAVLPVTISKPRCSHSVHAVIPLALRDPLRSAALDLGLSFSIGKTFRGGAKVQIVVKHPDLDRR